MVRPSALSTVVVTLAVAMMSCDARSDSETTGSENEPGDLPSLIDDQAARYLQLDPNFATYFGVPPEQTGGQYAHRLTDYSPAGERARRDLIASFVAELDALGAAGLDPADALTFDVARAMFEGISRSKDFEFGIQQPLFETHDPYVVSQISGPHISIPELLANQHGVRNRQDAEDYLSRLRAVGPTFDGVIEKIDADAAAGVTPPRVLLERTLEGLDRVLAVPAREQDLVTALAGKLEASDLSADGRSAVLADATGIVDEVVLAAYGRLRDKVAGLVPTARSEAGVWALPRGEAFYRVAIRQQTGSDLTPDEIHDLGLAEVARIEAEIDGLLRQQGMTTGSVGARLAALGDDPSYLFPDTEAGHAEILNTLGAQIARIQASVADYFGTVPPQGMEIRAVPEVIEASAPGGRYDAPSLDGTRPGIYWINLRDMKAWPSWTLPTLTYHEGVPGHHHQIATTMGLADTPLLRQIAFNNAYVEGWALYAELLAMEMGMYADDPMGNVGRLRDELYRAVRLVVDTGLHHKRWTREQAIDYMTSTTGVVESDIQAEIERYMAWPGQALGYKLGMIQILELREEARQTMGDSFDLRAFHDVVLGAGGVPMEVLRRRVRTWAAGG